MLPKGTRSLTLKQRLAALTQSPSSPQSPLDPSTPGPSPTSKRRFNAPWTKRTPAQNGRHDDEVIAEDRMQLIITRMIYQAGVDYECAYPTRNGAQTLSDPL
jgi:Rho GTPase-activating protein 1